MRWRTENGLILPNTEIEPPGRCSLLGVNNLSGFGAGGGASGDTDPDFSSVTLLLHCNGTDEGTTFTDDSDSGHTMTAAGNANTEQSTKKFGAASMELDGTGDYVSGPTTGAGLTDFAFGTGDFTIEAQIYFTGISGNIGLISWGGQGLVSADYDGWLVYQDAAANLLTVRKRTNGGGTASTYTFSWTPSTATWYALALSRNSNNLRVFIDGSQIGVTTTASDNLNDSDSKGVRLGAAGDGGGPLNGFIDEVRITKGVGRYTAGYTAQTAEFPNS